ncbi:MAG: MBL fold metallo-hydrolase [Bacteroidetes bacterium]|nr:MBL fold metallo-hydrolase [Bacteroidota bacterium]
MNIQKHVTAVTSALLIIFATCTPAQEHRLAESVEVTILSSNLANGATVGEWGFSALVRADDKCILFDAGRFPDTVLRNARALNVDLSCVTDVVLSHFHYDHTTGLLPLFKDIRAKNPEAIKRVHVAEGFFRSRQLPSMSGDDEWNIMIAMRKELEAADVEFLIYAEPTEILPSIWVTGPVKRTHEEKTYPTQVRMNVDGEWVEDYVPDSQGLTIVTPEGPIVLLGCGHSGSVNLLEQVQRDIQDHSILALMGGMHLFAASPVELDWTATKLTDIGIQHLIAGHCTGVEPLMHLRRGLNLDRKTAVVGAVGSRFVLGEGIHPTAIAQ